jgi:hypothetical protein
MDTVPTAILFLIFLLHLAAFAFLGLRRRQPYYLALVVTFALLSASLGVRLFAPEIALGGDLALHHALRVAAWPAAAVSIGWTLLRARKRRLARR